MRRPLSIKRLDARTAGFGEELAALLRWEASAEAEIESEVRAIVTDVRTRGDSAVLEYTRRFDGLDAESVAELVIAPKQLRHAFDAIDGKARQALEVAAERITRFHSRQRQESWSFEDEHGNRLGQRVTALDRVGVYVPGGKAAYPSSVLMNVIPARVAGVTDVALVTPAPNGEVSAMVLAAAHIAGVDTAFRIGGAQAVAALAYGTESVSAVDKITGPGNAYVAAAKRQVFGAVGIDMIAGPSEILIIGDASSRAHWVAMDLFAQAEHDEQARAILVSTSDALLDGVEAEIAELLPDMERETIIRRSLSSRGVFIRVASLEQAVEVANTIAPEHLELSFDDAEAWLAHVRHAGSVFVGPRSCEVLGDYCAGPNHVLPTAGTARFSSPLGVHDFQKHSGVLICSAEGARRLGDTAVTLACSEGLSAHARAAALRVEDNAGDKTVCCTVVNQSKARQRHAEDAMADAREVVRRLIAPETRALSAYHVPAADGLLKLDAMENPYRWPPALVETWLEELRAAEVNRYPDPGGVELKRLTRKALCIPAGLELLLGNGSDELIQLVAVALRQPGRTVLTPRPTFSMYKLISVVTGFDYVGVPLTDGEFALDKAALLAAIARHQPALVFLAYPNNPTGNLFDKDHIREVIRATPGLVVIDEAYAPFAGQSLLDAPLEFPNVVVMRTLSKLGLAGLRIGLMVGPPAWMEEFEKLRLPYNIGTLNQLTANFALRHYEVLEAQAARIRQDREALYAELKTLSGIRPYPSDANFITFSVPAGRAGEVFDGLRAAGVLIKNLHGSDPALSDHLRVTVGTPEQNSRFLEALAGVLARVA